MATTIRTYAQAADLLREGGTDVTRITEAIAAMRDAATAAYRRQAFDHSAYLETQVSALIRMRRRAGWTPA